MHIICDHDMILSQQLKCPLSFFFFFWLSVDSANLWKKIKAWQLSAALLICVTEIRYFSMQKICIFIKILYFHDNTTWIYLVLVKSCNINRLNAKFTCRITAFHLAWWDVDGREASTGSHSKPCGRRPCGKNLLYAHQFHLSSWPVTQGREIILSHVPSSFSSDFTFFWTT